MITIVKRRLVYFKNWKWKLFQTSPSLLCCHEPKIVLKHPKLHFCNPVTYQLHFTECLPLSQIYCPHWVFMKLRWNIEVAQKLHIVASRFSHSTYIEMQDLLSSVSNNHIYSQFSLEIIIFNMCREFNVGNSFSWDSNFGQVLNV